jgi:pyridoxal 5'-phosphate synthase pdxT subunit
MPKIGVLAFQGNFEKHSQMLASLGAATLLIRTAADLDTIDAVIIPGGESTTIGKLMNAFGVLEPLRRRILAGMPVFGTCAGLILLAPQIQDENQFRLGVLDIEVERNAYGRQVDSFEADIVIPFAGEPPVRGVFIRAPMVTRVDQSIEILARFEDQPVLLRKDNILAASFHPELTDDTRIHAYFLSMVSELT